MRIDTRRISAGTVTRTLVLLLGLINQGLTITGHSPLPFENQQVADFVAMTWTAAAALWAWWKNNSVTEAAIEADAIKDILRLSYINEENDAEQFYVEDEEEIDTAEYIAPEMEDEPEEEATEEEGADPDGNEITD